ncbi:MAG: 50S ribosomal protein L21 [Clostridiales bacterium]|nr:50S ribosomal protein L21 [Clostridiales bacterium]
MYAVVVAGGKQFKVEKDDVIEIEKISGAVGDKVEFPVLMTVDGDKVAAGPAVKAKATAEVLAHDRAKKIVVFKYKAKKNERKKQGHRQPFTRVKIVSIG